MVLIVVKGTQYPDAFVVERRLTDVLSSDAPLPETGTSTNIAAVAVASSTASSPSSSISIVPAIAHLVNKRHQLRLMLMSAQELATMFPHQSDKDRTEGNAEVFERYSSRITELQARLKDTKALVQTDEFDLAEEELRAMTVTLYPALCTHAEGPEAAVQALYTRYEDPDLNEDTRLLAYHCRVLLDPAWKSNERVTESTAALWFCGKPMEGTLAKYAGRNEKSKIIVKVSARTGPAPSGEPRMRYEEQRALYQNLCQRREAYKQLEDSELRDRVLRQARGAVHLSTGGGNGGAVLGAASPELRAEALRPIFPRTEERDVPLA